MLYYTQNKKQSKKEVPTREKIQMYYEQKKVTSHPKKIPDIFFPNY